MVRCVKQAKRKQIFQWCGCQMAPRPRGFRLVNPHLRWNSKWKWFPLAGAPHQWVTLSDWSRCECPLWGSQCRSRSKSIRFVSVKAERPPPSINPLPRGGRCQPGRGGVLHDNDADVTPQGRLDFIALGLVATSGVDETLDGGGGGRMPRENDMPRDMTTPHPHQASRADLDLHLTKTGGGGFFWQPWWKI